MGVVAVDLVVVALVAALCLIGRCGRGRGQHGSFVFQPQDNEHHSVLLVVADVAVE